MKIHVIVRKQIRSNEGGLILPRELSGRTYRERILKEGRVVSVLFCFAKFFTRPNDVRVDPAKSPISGGFETASTVAHRKRCYTTTYLGMY